MKNLIVRHSGSSVIITTECKRQQTAINRFSKFLADYDSEFTETMLKCFMSLSPVYNHDGVCGYKSKYWHKDYSCELLFYDSVYMLVLDFSETISEEETSFFESGLNYSDSDTSGSDSVTISLGSLDDVQVEATNDTTSDTSDTVTIVLGSFDDVETDIYICPQIFFNSENFFPVPRWFYQRSNIYAWSAVLSAFLAVWGLKDRRKRVIVKPVRISPRGCYPVRVSPYGMSFDYYPYKMFVDGSEVWDCRSHAYNEYLADLIDAPSYDELPF